MRAGPRYVALAEAIGDDIRSGRLVAGTRLPPLRALARQLKLNATTVARAYSLAARRGFVTGEIGRGTFVRVLPDTSRVPWPQAEVAEIIDLSSNFPVSLVSGDDLLRGLGDLGVGRKPTGLMDYRAESAHPAHLAAAAIWLSGLGLEPQPERILLTSGVTHGGFVCLLACTRPGDRLLVEELTSPAIIGAANTLGLRLDGIAMDGDGILPEALEEALRRERAAAVYLVPSLQNPTVAVMPEARRRVLVEIAAKHGVLIIEDDVFGALLDTRPPPLAAMAPERVCYITSLSKAVAPGLRVGYLLVPPALHAAALGALRVSLWMVSPLLGHLASRWIADGTAGALAARQRDEIKRRQALAREVLEGLSFRSHPNSLHLWLRVPDPWRAPELAAYLKGHGVAVLPSEHMAASPGYRPAGVRVSLGNVDRLDKLGKGLSILADVLRGRL